MRFIKNTESVSKYAEELAEMAKKLEKIYVTAEAEGYSDEDYNDYQDLLADMQTEALRLNTEIDEIRRNTAGF